MAIPSLFYTRYLQLAENAEQPIRMLKNECIIIVRWKFILECVLNSFTSFKKYFVTRKSGGLLVLCIQSSEVADLLRTIKVGFFICYTLMQLAIMKPKRGYVHCTIHRPSSLLLLLLHSAFASFVSDPLIFKPK